MKKGLKLIGALSMLFILMLFASSYVGRPMFGTTTSTDNTGRQLTYYYAKIADTAGSTCDTLTVIPNGYDKYYNLTVADSCVVAIKGTATSFTGSHIRFIIHAPASSNAFVTFMGYSLLANQFQCTGNVGKKALTSSRDFVISYICTGTKWNEEYESQD